MCEDCRNFALRNEVDALREQLAAAEASAVELRVHVSRLSLFRSDTGNSWCLLCKASWKTGHAESHEPSCVLAQPTTRDA